MPGAWRPLFRLIASLRGEGRQSPETMTPDEAKDGSLAEAPAEAVDGGIRGAKDGSRGSCWRQSGGEGRQPGQPPYFALQRTQLTVSQLQKLIPSKNEGINFHNPLIH